MTGVQTCALPSTRVTGRIVRLAARDAADIERVLADLRQADCQVEDLELVRADLEDVFLSIMQGRNAQRTAVEVQA